MRFIFTGVFIFGCAIGSGFPQANPSISLDAPPFQGIKDDSRLAATPDVSAGVRGEFQQAVKDVHFDFDRADLRDTDRQVLASDAEWLKAHPDVIIRLEGNADDRGDIVYNVVLAGQRAETTRQALLRLGVPSDRIAFSTGWGKLYPVCTQADESCWSQNRRTHIALWPPEQVASAASSER